MAAEGEVQEEALPEWDGSGPSLVERSFMGHLNSHKAFLEQVLKTSQPSAVAPGAGQPACKEMAAGLPIEAARALVLLGPEPDGGPWRGLPAELACLAAALRLFARLMEGRAGAPDEGDCGRCCAAARGQSDLPAAALALLQSDCSSSSDARAERLEAAAGAFGFEVRRVASASESLKAMVAGRPVVCCGLLQAYVGVLEDPETGEELEQEVGGHCLMVVGGDLLGPSYVTFDPFGLSCGEVAHWSASNLEAASPVAWVELSPRLQ